MFISGELISLVTFPGVILHEVAHRFFCDIHNVEVYEIRYFTPFSQTAGHVIHQPTHNVCHRFFIGAGPLIINSLIAMLFTLPYGIALVLGTDFVQHSSSLVNNIQYILTWAGYSMAFHAIPSNQDVASLPELAISPLAKTVLSFFVVIITLLNVNYLGSIFRILYAYALSMVLPTILLYYL